MLLLVLRVAGYQLLCLINIILFTHPPPSWDGQDVEPCQAWKGDGFAGEKRESLLKHQPIVGRKVYRIAAVIPPQPFLS